MNIEQAISKVVRHQMLTLNFRIRDLSRAVGLDEQTVSNQLNDRTYWKIGRLYGFGKILGLSGSQILEDAERLVKLAKEAGEAGDE